MLISWALFASKREHFHPYNKIVTWDIRVWLVALHSYVNMCHVRHMMESLKSILRLPHSTRPSTLVLYWTCAVQHLQQLLMFWYCLCFNINNIKTLQKTNNFTVTQKTVRLWFMSCTGVVFFYPFFVHWKKSWPTLTTPIQNCIIFLKKEIKISLNIVWRVESRSMLMYLKNGV